MSSFELQSAEQNLRNAEMLFSQNPGGGFELGNLMGAQVAHSWAAMADDAARHRAAAQARIDQTTRMLESCRDQAQARAARAEEDALSHARESAKEANKRLEELSASLLEMLKLPIGASVLFKASDVIGALASRDTFFEIALIEAMRPWVESHKALEALAERYGERLGLSRSQMRADLELLQAPASVAQENHTPANQ